MLITQPDGWTAEQNYLLIVPSRTQLLWWNRQYFKLTQLTNIISLLFKENARIDLCRRTVERTSDVVIFRPHSGVGQPKAYPNLNSHIRQMALANGQLMARGDNAARCLCPKGRILDYTIENAEKRLKYSQLEI